MQHFLNFHHLRCFWMVAKAGSLRAASERWRISQPTLSEQIRLIEDALGTALFRRTSRQLVLTEAGRRAFDYAEEIFALGRELTENVAAPNEERVNRTIVGITDSLPKIVAWELLSPIFKDSARPVQLVCREGKASDLIEQLTAYRFDLVLADEPAPSNLPVKVFSTPLLTSEIVFCAKPSLASRYKKQFPKSLHEAPMLLPSHGTALRVQVDRCLQDHSLIPRVVAECDDSALLKAAALDGIGIIPIVGHVREEAAERYGFQEIGVADTCQFTVFLLSAERKNLHPSVRAIRKELEK